jgi:endonuclease-3 related protein
MNARSNSAAKRTEKPKPSSDPAKKYTHRALRTAAEAAAMRSHPDLRLRDMYRALLAAYGPRQWWPADSPFEVVLGAYLTQATAWRNVERSIDNLREAGLLTIEGIRGLPEEGLRQLIRPSGFIQRKAASIRAFVNFLDERFGGSMQRMADEPTASLRSELLALPGVGPETADAILLYALEHPVFVADEYMRRIVTRHELLPANASYAELQILGDRTVRGRDQKETARHANELHALMVEVGKRHCGPVPRCEGCPLEPFLPRSSRL